MKQWKLWATGTGLLRHWRAKLLMSLLCTVFFSPSKEAVPIKLNVTKVSFIPEPPLGATYLYDFTEASESQVIRLRGDRPDGAPYIGRVEIFMQRRWGVVCAEGWSMRDATVACKMLGYRKALRPYATNHSISNGDNWAESDVLMTSVNCTGRELLLANCSYRMIPTCPALMFAAVECEANPDATCRRGELYVNGLCYLVSAKPAGYALAERVCDALGGNVAWIDSPKTNVYISEILAAYPKLHTSEIFVLSEDLHSFAIPLQKRSPDSNRRHKSYESSSHAHCRAVRRHSHFFAMRRTRCDHELPYICEALRLNERMTLMETQFVDNMAPKRLDHSLNSVVPRPRILNGNTYPVPWQAHISISCKSHAGKKFSLTCGGAILSTRWVITAAHCICNDPDNHVQARAITIEVTVGRLEWAEKTQGKVFEVDSTNRENVVYNNGFNENDSTWQHKDYDVVLLKLKTEIEFNTFPGYVVHSITLTEDNIASFHSSSVICCISGWGLTEEGQSDSLALTLQYAMINNPTKCKDNTNLCASYTEGGIDACDGDSGGPLFCKFGHGHDFLVGITARQRDTSCKEAISLERRKHETEFVDVLPLVPWINNNIDN